jgi:hypothetical protein
LPPSLKLRRPTEAYAEVGRGQAARLPEERLNGSTGKPDGSSIRVEVWPKLIFRNEAGRLSKNGSQCSAVELAVFGDGQRLRASCNTYTA